jgi:hypothetical protein
MTSALANDRLFEVELGEKEAPSPAVPAGEAKTFRRYDQSQSYLLPPSLDDCCLGTTRRALSPRWSKSCSTSRRSTPPTHPRRAPRPMTLA